MKRNLGEISKASLLAWIVALVVLAAVIYSRFSFEQREPQAELAQRVRALEAQLQSLQSGSVAMKVELSVLRRRLAELEVAPPAVQSKPAAKEK